MLCICRLPAIVIFVASPVSLAFADTSSLPYSEGGYLPDFVKIVRQYNASGEPFHIQGTCKSACTIFLGIRNACVERDAKLMFHAGHDIAENSTGPDTRASRTMLYRYNEVLRRYLLEGHHMDTEEFHTLSGAELIDRFGYSECATRYFFIWITARRMGGANGSGLRPAPWNCGILKLMQGVRPQWQGQERERYAETHHQRYQRRVETMLSGDDRTANLRTHGSLK
jgi:hypothetical protein